MTPVCECHGEQMRWNPDRKMVAGGRFICNVRRRELDALAHRERRASSVEYIVNQRRSKLRRMRARANAQLDHLRREAEHLGLEP